MAMFGESSPPTRALFNDELIELEPTVQVEIGHAAGGRSSVGLLEGTAASLKVEVHNLRRSRLRAVALFLAVACGILFLWFLFTSNDIPMLILFLMNLRFVVAAAVAGILFSRMELS